MEISAAKNEDDAAAHQAFAGLVNAGIVVLRSPLTSGVALVEPETSDDVDTAPRNISQRSVDLLVIAQSAFDL